MGYQACKELDMTERLNHHHMSFYMGLEYPWILAFMRGLGTYRDK